MAHRLLAVLGVVAALAVLAWHEQATARHLTSLELHVAVPTARADSGGVAAAPAADDAAPVAVRHADADAGADARRHADAVIGSGRITPRDAEALTVLLGRVPRAEGLAIRRRLAHAINTRQLVPTETYFILP